MIRKRAQGGAGGPDPTAPAWTPISYLGRKSGVSNFRVTVTPPAGMTVVYPAGGATSGLNGGPVLA